MLYFSSRSGKGDSHYNILKDHNLHHYIPSNETVNKKKLEGAWKEIIRRHKRLPKILIREIVPAAINYRRYKRLPYTEEERDELIKCLKELGFDMEDELKSFDLDVDLPDIQVPTEDLLKRLTNHPLCKEIATEPVQLFSNGHFNEAVRKAIERFEHKVQLESGFDAVGKSLMGQSFSIPNPEVQLNSLSTPNEEEIQEGYQLMTMGAFQAIRNVFSHGDEDQRTPEEAYEMLMFINWLFRQLPK
jgi:uncharacterized protein (TIGR02391 family)